MAQGLNDLSEGKIRAGVYHADVKDAQKERLHVMWRVLLDELQCWYKADGWHESEHGRKWIRQEKASRVVRRECHRACDGTVGLIDRLTTDI